MNSPSSSKHDTTTVGTLSARMAWMIVGPIILTITGLNISFSGKGWFTLLDGVFLCVVGMMLVAKWYELASGEGRDSYGEPDTTASYPRFVWTFAPVAIAAWVFANFVGNYVVN